MTKIYQCECGKTFEKPNSFNAHKSNCKIHFEACGKDITEVLLKRTKGTSEARARNAEARKQEKLNQWIAEQHICKKCGCVMIEYFGTGRFCSQACANSRGERSIETKYKISQSHTKTAYTLEQFAEEKELQELAKTEVCPICGLKTNVNGMRTHLAYCKKKHGIKNFAKAGGVELDITVEELNNYIIDHPNCEICGKTVEETVRYTGKTAAKRLCVDHDHTTNKFRGMLCQVCNRQLGWYENNKEKIKKYLDK